jgi:hypothetical protein
MCSFSCVDRHDLAHCHSDAAVFKTINQKIHPMTEALAILSVVAFGLGLLFWLAVIWIDPLLKIVVESKLEFTDILHDYLVELHTTGSIRRDEVGDFMWAHFLASVAHALMYCLFTLILPISAPALAIHLLAKWALKNKIRD